MNIHNGFSAVFKLTRGMVKPRGGVLLPGAGLKNNGSLALNTLTGDDRTPAQKAADIARRGPRTK